MNTLKDGGNPQLYIPQSGLTLYLYTVNNS